MEHLASFFHVVLMGFVALFPPVNPVGTALIIDPFLHHLNHQERKTAAARVAMYCFLICLVALLLGGWIFKLFGISLPVVQLAGGLLICRMGWKLLASDVGNKNSEDISGAELHRKTEDSLFYPLAFPMTTGAGTISVLLTLSAHGHNSKWPTLVINDAALSLAILLMSVTIYLCYAFTPALLKRLGQRGEHIVNRLSSFLVFCVGIQIAFAGLAHLIKGVI